MEVDNIDLSEYKPHKKESFFEKHSSFVKTIYTVAFGIGTIWAIFQWILTLFETAKEGNMIGFLIALILQSVIMTFNALIFAAVVGTLATLILFLPYLIVRGFMK